MRREPRAKKQSGKAVTRSRFGWSETLAALLAFVFGVALQFQTTIAVADTQIRLNLADPLLLLIAPFLMLVLIIERRPLLCELGKTIPALLVMATAIFCVSFAIGWHTAGALYAWALVKFVGWFVLLGYFGLGLCLAIVGTDRARSAFALGLVLGVFATTLLYVSLNAVTDHRDWIVNYDFSLRFKGFSENPNAMGFLALAASHLAISYRALLARYAGMAGAIGVAGALIAAVMFSGSMAAMGALLISGIAHFAIGSIPLRTAMATAAVALVLLSLPNILPVLQLVLPNQFENREIMLEKLEPTERARREALQPLETKPWLVVKLLAITGMQQEGEYGEMARRTRDSRIDPYFSGLSLWRDHPILGAGLGTHLQRQSADYAKLSPNERPRYVMIHSTPLWLLAEAGIVGAAIFAALFLAIAYRLAMSSSAAMGAQLGGHPFVLAALCILIGWAVISLAHEFMYQRPIWLIAGLALAGLASSAARAPRSGRSG